MSSLIDQATIKHRRDTASNWTTNDPTPNQGEICLETDGGVKIGDGSTAWTSLSYTLEMPLTYDISAANTVIALPEINGTLQRYSIYWIGGDGSNTLSFTTTASATIGGLTASIWVGEGDGNIELESDGTSDWKVKGYEDSGSNANGDWQKERSGQLYCKARGLGLTTHGVNSNVQINWTFPHVMIDTSFVADAMISPQSTPDWYGVTYTRYDIATTTSIAFNVRNGGTSQNSSFSSFEATGRWRS